MDDILRFQEERSQSIAHQVRLGEKTIGYLYLSNAGAIVALIGYLAHKNSLSHLPYWKMSAAFFCIGMLLSMGSLALAYYYQTQVTKSINQQQRLAIYNSLYEKYRISEDEGIKDYILRNLTHLYKDITENPYRAPNNRLFTSCIAFALLSALCFLSGFLGVIIPFC